MNSWRQGCVTSSWVFNIYTAEVVGEGHERTQGRGVNIIDRDHIERSFLSDFIRYGAGG